MSWGITVPNMEVAASMKSRLIVVLADVKNETASEMMEFRSDSLVDLDSVLAIESFSPKSSESITSLE